MIIGLVGKIQSGKTTVANFLGEKINRCYILAFSDLLKEMIFKAGICTREELWEKKTVFSRMMMQKIGTEIIREQVNPNFWIDKMHQKIQGILLDYGRLTTIIIHDVRFINEATVVRTYSDNLLVRIVRPSLVLNKEENTHRSETEQDQIEVNLTIVNDGTLEELKEKALYLILNTELNNPSIGRMEIK